MPSGPAARPRPSLSGLVLAGGRGARMGRDKALLEYAGEPQLVRAARLLGRFCPVVRISVRPEQAALEQFAGFDLVVDEPGAGGPAAGLLAAWRGDPDAAWLVLAVDMPLVDASLLAQLIAARRPARLATAFRHADGTPEPLCAIWEPSARAAIAQGLQDGRSASLRRLLTQGPAHLLGAPDPARLRNANTPEEFRALELAAEGHLPGPGLR